MSSIALMVAVLGLGQVAERTEYRSESGQFQITAGDRWKKLPGEYGWAQVVLQRGNATIGIGGHESFATSEEVVDTWLSVQARRSPKLTILKRQTLKLGGQDAIQLKVRVVTDASRIISLTICADQGRVYEITGNHPEGFFSQDHEPEYQEVVKSFKFLERRNKFEARRDDPLVIGGGVARTVLDRRRWKETTFDFVSFVGVDLVQFQSRYTPALIELSLSQVQDNADAMVARVEEHQSPQFVGMKAEALKVKIAGDDVAARVLRGRHVQLQMDMVVSIVCVIREGFGLTIVSELPASLYDVYEAEWRRLLDQMEFQSPSRPARPLAYRLNYQSDDTAQADADLKEFLRTAKPVAGVPSNGIVSIAPGGAFALVSSGLGRSVVDLRKGTRKTLKPSAKPGDKGDFDDDIPGNRPLDPVTGGSAVSRDGSWVAFTFAEHIEARAVDGDGTTHRQPVVATALAFTDREDEVLAVTFNRSKISDVGVGRVFLQDRLEAINMKTGERTTLVEYPLARLFSPVASPDGTQIALVANRDQPRVSSIATNIYLFDRESKKLRQLTTGSELASSPTWSKDGKSLFYLSGDIDDNRFADGRLVRVDIASGQKQTLYPTNAISTTAVQDDHLLVSVSDYRLSVRERGLYRVPIEAVVAQAAKRKPRLSTKERLAKLDRALSEALDAPRLVDLPLTPARFKTAARVFAETMAAGGDSRFDFSIASLNAVNDLSERVGTGLDESSALLLGLGSYYGEVLVRHAGATWSVESRTLRDLDAGRNLPRNSLVTVVAPLGDLLSQATGSESRFTYLPEGVRRLAESKVVLVFPDSHAKRAIEEATPAGYREAQRRLDAGEIDKAVELLFAEIKKSPRNRALAEEVVALAELSGKKAAVGQQVRRAVENGIESPTLLIRHAEAIADREPKAALELYQKAIAQMPWVSPELILKLGEHYRFSGDEAMAESCFRRAHRHGSPALRIEVLRLMGLRMDRPINPDEVF